MIGPFRLNVWTSIVMGLVALVAFVLVGRRHPGRETTLQRRAPADQDQEAEVPDLT